MTRKGRRADPEHFETRLRKGRGRAQRSLDLIEAMYDAAEAAQPITGPETQAALISTIKAHLSAGDKAQDKAQRHYIAAGQHLKQLKAEHDGHDGTWAEWEALLKAVGISTGRASELMQIADGRKTADGLAVANTTRSKRHRSSLRNEEARLERAIKVVITALEEAGKDERAGILDRILNPIGMTAVAAKAGNGLCPLSRMTVGEVSPASPALTGRWATASRVPSPLRHSALTGRSTTRWSWALFTT
jgi:hypothetical protein